MFDELKSNPRLRLGLALAVGLLVAVQLLDVQAVLRAKRMEVARLQRQLDQFSAGATDTAWIDRAEAARALREQLDAGLWTVADAGVAEASFVDWMNRQLAEAKVGRPAVLSAIPAGGRIDAPALPAGARLLRLNVSFEFAPGVTEQMLERLAASGRFLVVDALNVRRQPLPKVDLTVTSIARLADTAEERKP